MPKSIAPFPRLIARLLGRATTGAEDVGRARDELGPFLGVEQELEACAEQKANHWNEELNQNI